MSSLYKALQFPINVYAHSLYLEEGHVDDLHYGLFQEGETEVSLSSSQQRATDFLLTHLPAPPRRILEIGLGLGNTARQIAGRGYSITAITPNAKEIHLAKQSIQDQVALECVHFEEFAAPPEKYDVILLQETAQHLSPSILFNKAYRLLAKEGIILIADEMSLKPIAKSLPLLTDLHIQAQRCGFRLTEQIDLSTQSAPTLDYFIRAIEKHRTVLQTDLDLNQDRLEALLTALQDKQQKYRDSHYGYFLLSFAKKSAEVTIPRTRTSNKKDSQQTTASKPTFSFRPYQAGDEHAIQTSFAEVFPSYRNLDTWHWIYTHNPDGSRIMLAVAENGDLAAHYASSVHSAIWAGQTTRIGFIRDVFSTSRYRTFTEGRRGVFVQNFEAFLDEWTGPNQLVMLYGFPSQRPFRLGKLLMQYQPFSEWYTYRYTVPVALQQHDTLGLIQAIKRFDTAYDRLWEKRAPQYQFAVCRNARFLNWRFIDIPHKKYWIWGYSPFLSTEVLGYVVIAPEKPQAKLIDFCFPEDDTLAESFWQQVIDILRWRGVKSIETWFSAAGSPHIIEALGFKAQARPDYMIPVFRIFHPDLDLQWLDANFYYTMADSDFY